MSSDASATGGGALTSKEISGIVLSDGSNPLTAPLPSMGQAASDRVTKRFAVEGNAIITGGAGCLGIEVARNLLEHGASGVSLFDINLDDSRQAIDTLRSDFPIAKVVTQEVDVRNEHAVDRAVSDTVEALGSVNILLCFAGVVVGTRALDLNPEDWRRALDVNTTGSWLCAQAAAKQMIKQSSGGSIVFISSIAGHRVCFPQPQVAYNVSKAALLHLKNSLAAEWAHYGIRVNSISPGYMDTVLTQGEGLEMARKIWMERIPLGRMGQPDELAGPVVLLCSGAGRYITGADIMVDGGGVVF